MRSESINKPDNTIRFLGWGALFCTGLAVGLSVHPIYNSLELQDARRDLEATQATLTDRNTEIETKDTMTNDFCKQFKEVK